MKKVFNLIIVDESGSMSVIRKQAFAGMNETLSTVRSIQDQYPDTEQRVTLVTFDSEHMKLHYDNVEAKHTQNLKWQAYNPCAATPLYDTIGKSVSKLNAMVDKGDNVLVTIITDGEENCSQEWSLQMINKLIGKLKEQGWTFTLIGTDNLDVESMAHSMCIDEHLKFCEDAAGTDEMFMKERKARIRFSCRVAEGRALKKGEFFSEE
jgi:Mg-chelatase subunit ChlD